VGPSVARLLVIVRMIASLMRARRIDTTLFGPFAR
jgi:hypothetical protein